MNVLSQKITHFTVFFIGGFPKWKIAQNCTFLGKKSQVWNYFEEKLSKFYGGII